MNITFNLLATVAIVVACSFPAFAENKPQPQKNAAQGEKSKESKKSIPKAQDCDKIRGGTGGSVTESAAEKDCQSSHDLGAGSGTSSGTGSGKMAPGQGPR